MKLWWARIVGDQKALAECARTNPDAAQRKSAASLLTDRQVLLDVATSDKDHGVRDVAADRLVRFVLQSAPLDHILDVEPLFFKSADQVSQTIRSLLGKEWSEALCRAKPSERRIRLLLSPLLARKDFAALAVAGSVLCTLNERTPDKTKALMLWKTRDQTRHVDGSAKDVDKDELYLCEDGRLVVCTTRGRYVSGVDWDTGGNYSLSQPRMSITDSDLARIVRTSGEGFGQQLAARIMAKIDLRWLSQPPAAMQDLRR